MSKFQTTKILSWIEIQKDIGQRQKQVYNALCYRGPMSNHELSVYLHLPINSITPRVNELVRMDMVIKKGTKQDIITKRKVNVWGVA